MTVRPLFEFYRHVLSGRVHRGGCPCLRNVPAGRLVSLLSLEGMPAAALCVNCYAPAGSRSKSLARRGPAAVGASGGVGSRDGGAA